MTSIIDDIKMKMITRSQQALKATIFCVVSFFLLALSACNAVPRDTGNTPRTNSQGTVSTTSEVVSEKTAAAPVTPIQAENPTTTTLTTSGQSPTQEVSPSTIILTTLTPASIPNDYVSIYSNLKSILDTFSADLDTQVLHQNEPIFGAELLPANCNRGEDLLKPGVLTSVQLYLDRLQSLGVQGVTFPIHYPLYTPGYPRFTEYVAFYKQVVQEIRKRGMKLDIESHVIFANTVFSPIIWDYSKLTFEAYKIARRDLITRVINDFHPDFLNLGAEPDTEATLLGMKDLLYPHKYTEFVSYLLDGLVRGDTKVVAGIGSWGNLEYARELATLPTLDGLSLHVYPVIGGALNKAVQIADYAKANGKFIVFDECWLSKTDVQVSNGVAGSPEIFRRDAYSFWAPLDQEFLDTMVKFSRVYDVAYISPFWTDCFFAYLDYTPSTMGLTYPEMSSQHALAEYTNLRSGTYTSTANYYKSLITKQGYF
jgi:hypothetical protein